ncbi:MAG: DUF6364 family protein [Opitutales bacterium]|nr:DUF6364 family protein [Opitutales bacterium]
MQTKLTLRMEEALIRKAKRIARRKGTSVSKIFGEYIKKESDEGLDDELPPITSSMLGVLKNDSVEVDEGSYHKQLEEKYL